MSHITIHICDTATGVAVVTTAHRPTPGRRLTAAESLALDMLMRCSPATNPTYGAKPDAATELARDLLNTERFGWAVTAEVRDAARIVLGIAPCEGARA